MPAPNPSRVGVQALMEIIVKMASSVIPSGYGFALVIFDKRAANGDQSVMCCAIGSKDDTSSALREASGIVSDSRPRIVIPQAM